MIIFTIVLYIFLILVPIMVLYFVYKTNLKKQRQEWLSKKRYTVLQIVSPKNDEKTPLAAEQMFASIHGIYKLKEKYQDEISFEIVARKKYIYLYVRVPYELKDFIEGQIYAQYPAVEIFEVPDYSREIDHEKVAGCELLLTKEDVYPIKTFVNFEVDPLSAITGVLSKIEMDEQVWIQLITRPVSDNWQVKGISYVSAIQSGKSIGGGNIVASFFKTFFKFIIEVIKTIAGQPSSAPESSPEVKLSGPQEAALKGIEEKATKLGFECKIRIVSLAKQDYIALNKVNAVTGAFKQYNTTNLNGFISGAITTQNEIIQKYQNRDFEEKGYILNIEEIASVFHLPSIVVTTPNFIWAGSKKGEPPSNLPLLGVVPNEDLTVFAQTNFRHLKQQFGIKKIDRRLHLYAIGKTGTGKSTLLENMIIDDIKEGRGVAVVDPHGELINHILDFIPSNRINDVIYFNPSDRDFPIGFNPLENVDPELKNIVASGVVGIFKKIFGDSWGPRLEYILRNAILALLEYPDSTLLGVMKILVDKEFRKKVIAKVQDPVVKEFFVNEYDKWDQKFRLEAIQSIQNKVGQFLSSSVIRNIVGQPKSSFNIRQAMDESKILLLDLSTGKIGEDNASLLGGMMITKIQLAAMQRADVTEDKRTDFYLYVDEFQNFATDSFAVILSEARKYHLNLIMTNQYIAQMPEAVANAVFGNVGTIVSFRVGAQDASVLEKEFEPVFVANDLVNLNNYHIYIKMAIDGVTRPAFSAITLPPGNVKNNNREKIINSSRERNTKDRVFVEQKIDEWSRDSSESIKKEVNITKDDSMVIVNPVTTSSSVKNGYKEIITNKGDKWYILENNIDNEKTKIENAKELVENKDNNLIFPDEIIKKDTVSNDIKKSEKEQISLDSQTISKQNDDLKVLEAGETVKIDST